MYNNIEWMALITKCKYLLLHLYYYSFVQYLLGKGDFKY